MTDLGKVPGGLPYLNPDFPLETRVDDLISRMTLEEKIGLIPTRQAAIERLGIQSYRVGGEAAHGLVEREGPATVFPQTIGLSCSWDTDLLFEIGSAISDEARAYYYKKGCTGGLTLWAPTVDLERDPRWGRTEEAYGEDPHLTGEMSTALVKGMQGAHPFYLKMAATLKHFFANNNETDRLTCSTTVDPRNMREYYWNAFKPSIVNGGTCCLMTAYNSINGRPAILNQDVKNVVKGEWGLQGFVVADGSDFSQTVTHHKYYDNHAESIAETLKSGVDCIPDDPELIKNALREAVARGLLSEGDLDNALRNILRIRFRLGQFDPDSRNPYAGVPETVICSPEHRALARRAVRETTVLLKNKNHILPLQPTKIKKAAVIGPLGDTVYRDWYTGIPPYKVTPLMGIRNRIPHAHVSFVDGRDQIAIQSVGNGRWLSPDPADGCALYADQPQPGDQGVFKVEDWGWGRYTLQSQATGKYLTTSDTEDRITASAEEVWGWYVKELYDLVPGTDSTFSMKTWDHKQIIASGGGKAPLTVTTDPSGAESELFRLDTLQDGIQEAVIAAKDADVALVFLGNHPLINGKEEIDRPDITLPPRQERLLKAVYAANPNTVLVLIGSYPYALDWAHAHIPAIVYLAQAGQEAGNGIADTLFGEYNPAGRLSMTWYQSVEQLPDIMDYDIIKGKRTYQYFEGPVRYPFGYGLSYTSFQYSGLSLDKAELGAHDTVMASFRVTNIGPLDGDEVVQLYVSSKRSRVMRPLKQLKGFKRLHMKAGETLTVNLPLSMEELAFWDVTREQFCVESGSYTVMVGSSSQDIRMSAVIQVHGETVPPRDLFKRTRAENYDDYLGIYLDESKEDRTCVRPGQPGAWLAYRDAATAGSTCFKVRAASAGEGGRLEIRLDGPEGALAGVCMIVPTGGWQQWETFGCKTEGVAERHDIYLVLRGDFSIAWFQFG